MPEQFTQPARPSPPAPRKAETPSIFKREIVLGRVSLTQRALFARHLAMMLNAGMTLSDALLVTQQTVSGGLARILGTVVNAVQSGRKFSEALGQYPAVFSGIFIQSARAGEQSGSLAAAMDHVATQLDRERRLIRSVRAASFYPAVVLVAAFGLSILFTFVIFPQIATTFDEFNVTLPWTTRIIIAFAKYVEQHTAAIGVGTIGGAVALVWLVRQRFARPITHYLLLRTPVLARIVRGVNLARFTRALGTLLESGLHIDEALEISGEGVGNMYYRRAIEQLSRHVTRGFKFSESLERYDGMFSMTMKKMVQIGEISGRLADSLFYLASYYESDVDEQTKVLASLLEPIVLIGIGLIVGFLAYSIMTPIFLLTSSV